MLTRKSRFTVLAVLGLGFGSALGLAPLANNPFAPTSALAAKDKVGRANKAANRTELSKRNAMLLEKIAGKPLTEDQKKAALQAENEFRAAMKTLEAKRDDDFAKALGMTTTDYLAARKKADAEGRTKKDKTPAP
jgi:hypothetical protein